MKTKPRTVVIAVALVLAGALGSNLLGAVRATQAQALSDEVVMVAVENGVWLYTRRDGIEFCFVQTTSVRCLRR